MHWSRRVVARAVRHYSKRRLKSWVEINCTALPENLLESELFGHERGAFSGADSAKQGGAECQMGRLSRYEGRLKRSRFAIDRPGLRATR